MQTTTILPAVDGLRFGSMAVGYDRINTIRSEHAALCELAETVLGREPSTPLEVANLALELKAKIDAAMNGEEFGQAQLAAQLRELRAGKMDEATRFEVAKDLVAMALAFVRD